MRRATGRIEAVLAWPTWLPGATEIAANGMHWRLPPYPSTPTATEPCRTLRRLTSIARGGRGLPKPAIACSCDFLVGLRLRRSSRRLCQCADRGAARQFDLEGVVSKALGVTQQQVRSAIEAVRA